MIFYSRHMPWIYFFSKIVCGIIANMEINFEKLDIKTAHNLLVSKELTVRELTDFYLKNIEEKNEDLNIYLSVFKNIDEQIKKAQDKIDIGEATLLTGIPAGIKANILIKGENTTAASKILENYTATYDAFVIKKLKEEGVVFLGYTNMDEFAAGGSTQNSAYGVTKNALDNERVSGGSSGGSAAAVAAQMAMFTLGTDTGGSVRQPAAFNGIVGMKGSYGSVSRSGAIAMGSSLDQIGPIAKTVEDAEIVFNAIKGKDERDMTSLNIKEDGGKEIKKLAIIPEMLKNLDDEIKTVFMESVEEIKSLGYEIKEIDFPELKLALPIYYTLMPAELSSNVARYDGIRYGNTKEGENLLDTYLETKEQGYGDEIKRRIILGTYVLSAGYAGDFYAKALGLREELKNKFKEKMEEVDALILPTFPTIAPKIGEITNPIDEYIADIYTVSANILGSPAISFPSKEKIQGLPMGIQIMSDFESEKELFDFSKTVNKKLAQN